MSGLPRLLDANANRAREALRVLEDVARFHLDAADLSASAKALRHDLRGVLDRLPAGWLEANRDTPGDVGRTIKTPAEQARRDLHEVAVAAGKRLSEALRALEEGLKMFAPALAASIEQLRYRAYELERRVQARLGSSRATQWCVCVLLTESLCRLPWRAVLEQIVEAGVDCIQVREKEMDGGPLLARVREVLGLARPKGISVIVNDRVDVALAAGADGVHLGTTDLPIDAVRRLAGRSLIIGASTHDMDEARRAIESGADYCGVGAMFATGVKPERTPSGIDYLRDYLGRYPRTPHLAIGGITSENVRPLVEAGARGVAVSAWVCGSEEPALAVKSVAARLPE